MLVLCLDYTSNDPSLFLYFGHTKTHLFEQHCELERYSDVRFCAKNRVKTDCNQPKLDKFFGNVIKIRKKLPQTVTKAITLTEKENSQNQTIYSINMVTNEKNHSKQTGKPLNRETGIKTGHNGGVEHILNTTEKNRNYENIVVKETPKKTERKEASSVKASLISGISR